MALQENRNIERITIVGGGTSGYLSALFLGKTYPEKSITWIYPEDNNPIGVGEALVPPVSKFLYNLGISHEDILKHCNGTLKLGIKLEDFSLKECVFPFGIGASEENSILNIIKSNKIPSNILDYQDISVHLRTTEALTFIEKLIPSNVSISRDKVDRVEGYDLLVDCTGFTRKFSYLKDNHKSISHIIPNNRALSYRAEYTNLKEQMLPYSIFKAMDFGWVWNIPLGDQLAMGYVHNSKYDVQSEFISYIKDKMGIIVEKDDIDEIDMVTGRNKIHLHNNIVPIGLSSGFIEPLESTGLYLTTYALETLSKYINSEISEKQYNESINSTFDGITDFIGAHYKFSNRDNEYWNMYKDIDINLYNEIDIFPKEAWDYILSGFGMTERPKEQLDIKEMIKISKGINYTEWYESNFK
jgi:tryptophan 7-halogenase